MEKISFTKTNSGGALNGKGIGAVTAPKKTEAKGPEAGPRSVAPAAKPAVSTVPAKSPASSAKREIKLELYERNARAVTVAGSFNGWDRQTTPLRSLTPGKWETTLLLAPGRYEYRFVVDGKWSEDPLAKESVPNPYGGVNSILVVK